MEDEGGDKYILGGNSTPFFSKKMGEGVEEDGRREAMIWLILGRKGIITSF